MHTEARTSTTHPLQIATIAVPGGGMLGLTFLPGKHQAQAMTGSWMRDLQTDLDALQAWGATLLIPLVEPWEFSAYHVPNIADEATSRRLEWCPLPFVDDTAPDAMWDAAWHAATARVRSTLDAHGQVAIFCKGGLGRTGVVACKLLIERGMDPIAALTAVRAVRPGAVCTEAQEHYVCNHDLPPPRTANTRCKP